MIPSVYVAPSPIHGLGLFAAERIETDSVIGWLRGRPCVEDGSYVLWVAENRAIEVLCDLRYINHSEQPNACYYDDLSVIALCDIEAGDEITHNYACVYW